MDRFLAWSGTALMLLLLWRMVTWRAWRFYPLFFAFFSVLFARVLLIEYLDTALRHDLVLFSRWYWYSSLLVDIVRFFVAWECYRKLLPWNTVPHRIAGAALVLLMIGMAIFYALLGAREVNVILDAKLNLSFAVAVWMFVTLGAARYYGVVPSLNAWGIAVGTGIFAAFSVVNFSALGINEAIYPAFRYVRPLSFVATLLIWLWTLWSFHREPRPQPAAP